MKFTLYHSDSRETPANCTYMHKVEVTDKDTLRQIVTDTGAVIGWLAPEMDNALGQMQKLKVRYA